MGGRISTDKALALDISDLSTDQKAFIAMGVTAMGVMAMGVTAMAVMAMAVMAMAVMAMGVMAMGVMAMGVMAMGVMAMAVMAMAVMAMAVMAMAERVIIAESTWDIIACIDLYDLHKKTHPWCAIATRGASNSNRIATDSIKDDAIIYLLRQNDDANREWHGHLPRPIMERGRLITPPPEIKDLNDWMKVKTRDEIQRSLRNE
jgi:hypothetical protein